MSDSDTLGLPIDPAVRALILVEERLKNMERHAEERAEAQARQEQKVDSLQATVVQLATDIAVLKSQHASFWRAATVLFGALSLIGGAIGWVANTLLGLKH